MYAILVGTLPFDGDDADVVMDKVLNEEPDYDYHVFRKLTPDAQELIKSKKIN